MSSNHHLLLVDLFKRLSRHSLLSEQDLLGMLADTGGEQKDLLGTNVPLRSKTLAGVAHHIARNRCKNVIVMVRANCLSFWL